LKTLKQINEDNIKHQAEMKILLAKSDEELKMQKQINEDNIKNQAEMTKIWEDSKVLGGTKYKALRQSMS
jgi:hypothetical protein